MCFRMSLICCHLLSRAPDQLLCQLLKDRMNQTHPNLQGRGFDRGFDRQTSFGSLRQNVFGAESNASQPSSNTVWKCLESCNISRPALSQIEQNKVSWDSWFVLIRWNEVQNVSKHKDWKVTLKTISSFLLRFCFVLNVTVQSLFRFVFFSSGWRHKRPTPRWGPRCAPRVEQEDSPSERRRTEAPVPERKKDLWCLNR